MSKLKLFGAIFFVVFLTVLTFVLTGPVRFVAQGNAQLPAPTGDHQVGRLRLALTDSSRDDILSENPNDQREIVVNIFYPAEHPENAHVGDYTEAQGLQSVDGVPAVLINPVTPNFVDEAPAAEDQFPVLLFGAGFAGPVTYYTSLIEEVVSHGYIVMAVEHPYHFTSVNMPDGRLIEGSDFGLNEGAYDTEAYKEQLSAVLVEDFQFALDEAERLNEASALLQGRFALDKVGAFGHSMGGQTVATLGLVDERVTAVVNYDGSIIDERVIEQGVNVPYLLVYDDFSPPSQDVIDEFYGASMEQWWADFAGRNYPASLQNGNAPFHVVQIENAKHISFYTDLVFLKPMFPFVITEDMVGHIEAETMLDATANVTLAFFQTYLIDDATTTTEALADTHAVVRPNFNTSGWGITVK